MATIQRIKLFGLEVTEVVARGAGVRGVFRGVAVAWVGDRLETVGL
jgi:hypothetical protein